ncbi:MAG: divalent-cation tolerance protein CutA [Candidatus Omnitrophota bacterium]
MNSGLIKNIVVLITASSYEEAEKIASRLVSQKLAACVNIVDNVESLFWWKGKVDRAEEVLLIIKSKQAVFKRIVSEVKKLHRYEVPEIIALPIIVGDEKYMRWLNESVR